MTTRYIGGPAAARIGRLIGLEVDAATAELQEDNGGHYTIFAYASEMWASAVVYYFADGGGMPDGREIPDAGEFTRAYPQAGRKVVQLFFDGEPALCVDAEWNPSTDVFGASAAVDPFMPDDCGARICQAYDEFKAELALMEKEGEHVE